MMMVLAMKMMTMMIAMKMMVVMVAIVMVRIQHCFVKKIFSKCQCRNQLVLRKWVLFGRARLPLVRGSHLP